MKECNLKEFRAIRVEYRNSDKYGKIQVDGHHYYSILPEMGQKRLLVVLSAEKVEIYHPEKKQKLVTHRREYGKKRTDSDNPWATLRYLSRHPKSWENSQLRQVMDPDLRQALDQQTRNERSKSLRTLDQLKATVDIPTACQALKEALDSKLEDPSISLIFAKRIQEGGIDMQPLPGPDLTNYDAFLIHQEVLDE